VLCRDWPFAMTGGVASETITPGREDVVGLEPLGGVRNLDRSES